MVLVLFSQAMIAQSLQMTNASLWEASRSPAQVEHRREKKAARSQAWQAAGCPVAPLAQGGPGLAGLRCQGTCYNSHCAKDCPRRMCGPCCWKSAGGPCPYHIYSKASLLTAMAKVRAEHP